MELFLFRLFSAMANFIQRLFPSPFSLAIILTLLSFVLAFQFGEFHSERSQVLQLFEFWEQGMWTTSLMAFTIQMMMMLLLGYVLALAPSSKKIILTLVGLAKTNTQAIVLVAVPTLLMAFFNWGLGLVFGAILTRKMGEHLTAQNIPFNYPILGAAGYSGLLIWHGGFSGSSISKVNEPGHLKELVGNMSPTISEVLPIQLNYNETIFSSMNLTVFFLMLLLIPTLLIWVSRSFQKGKHSIQSQEVEAAEFKAIGAEKLDHSKWGGIVVGGIILSYALYKMFFVTGFSSYFTPNNINLLLLALALLAHQSIVGFLNAIQQGVGSVSGILIQFPLYFGIIGLCVNSGILNLFSDWIVSNSSKESFPIFTLFSAAVVNLFVPSGGGQWAVQGPILIKAATELNVPLGKAVLALAYGDQLTNMLQPFWALPLLGITGLKAKEILPVTVLLLLLGALVFTLALLLF